MNVIRMNRNGARQAVLLSAIFGFLLGTISPADAAPRRHRRHSRFAVALQPFLLARRTVHAVADPIVFGAPRVALRMAAAPVRVAYLSTRTSRALPPDERSSEDEPANVGPIESRGSQPTVAGHRALLRNGIAYAPASAPQNVKQAIWAANTLRRKPYVWGGGHGSFSDYGYDCSGTVSFALHGAGALPAPLPSNELMRYGERGRGRWITIYARRGHTFASIAGLRLDTTDFLRGGNTGPRWHLEGRDTRGFVARHPAGM